MGLRISIDLDEEDLRHFRLIMREARNNVANAEPELIVAGAQAALKKVDHHNVAGFVVERIDKLAIMISMLTDHEWRLPQKDTTRVLNALAYFADPEDLIPDTIPGIGYLDDAIMIELVIRELKHEIEAYEDFCRFRQSRPPPKGIKTKTSDINRESWLERRRKDLLQRMRRRRSKQKGRPDGGKPLL